MDVRNECTMSESSQEMEEIMSMYRVPVSFITLLILFASLLSVPQMLANPSISGVFLVVITVVLSFAMLVFFWSVES